jgi:polyhydroxyalkanoate synthesis regulator phasin
MAADPSPTVSKLGALATLWEAVRRGLESLAPSTAWVDRIDAALADVGARFETRVRENRQRIVSWTGLLDQAEIAALSAKIDALESRLGDIEQLLNRLDGPR